jgi:glycosyltransferase involved in cell wall biosynthesis
MSAHILCVGEEWFPTKPGGLNRYVYELSNQLVMVGEQVEIFGYEMPEHYPQENPRLTNLGRSIDPILQRLCSARKGILQRKNVQFDAINLHFSLYSFPLMADLPKDVPITFTFHGPWSMESKQEKAGTFNVAMKSWIESWVYHRCDRFIVLSAAFGRILHETYSISWEKIHIIPGGVDIDHFQISLSRQKAQRKLKWPQDRPILFTTRRLVHRMGLDKLLKSLFIVKAKVPNVWLAIAGKGPLRETLEQQVRDLNLEDNVEFLDFLPDEDLPVAYQAADLTVMPSQSLEGFGLVLLESLACGTPALCTPVGGMPEVVEPFYPALVTQSADEIAIAERLIDFLSGRLELPSREACREYAVNNFDWKAIALRVRQVLLA